MIAKAVASRPAACVSRPAHAASAARTGAKRTPCVARAYKVTMVELDGTEKDIEVEEGQTILDACLENGIETSYDCNMGVCMTCPAKMLAGEVDQAAGMLSEDTQAKGYALLCVATPTSDCKVQIIPEDELLNEQLGE